MTPDDDDTEPFEYVIQIPYDDLDGIELAHDLLDALEDGVEGGGIEPLWN